MPRARPGLPRCGKQVAVGRAGECRTRRLLLVFRRVRCRRHGLEFQHVVACSGGRESPGPRSSVALPLGINGSAARGGQGAGTTLLSWVGRSLRGLQQRELRASATGGFGPRDSVSRNYTASFVAPFCWFRPVAHPPERQSRWATRPATLWVANAQPKRLAQLSAHSSSGAPPGARLRRSLRAEDGDSVRNRAIRS